MPLPGPAYWVIGVFVGVLLSESSTFFRTPPTPQIQSPARAAKLTPVARAAAPASGHGLGAAPEGGAATLMRWWGLTSSETARCSAKGRRRRNVVVAFSSFKRSTGNATMLMLASFKKASSGRGIGGAVSKGGQPHDPSFEMVILSNRDPDHERFVALEEVIKDFPGASAHSIKDMMAQVNEDTPWAQSRHFLNMRPLYMLRWLQENPLNLCPDDGVGVADEDLVYQGDPFDIFDAVPNHALYVFGERTNFTNGMELGKVYIDMATGSNKTREHVKAGQTYCFGFALGEAWAVRELHARVAVGIFVRGFEATDVERHAMDQGMLNVLIHTGGLDDLGLRKVLNEEPWVTHLTSQLSGKKTIPFSELLDTRRIVHQYKWANSVKEHYLNQYGYVV
eukprot:m.459657 g.459657  ORF g.459657 m.459657 type:complete len:394 (-) comp21805_c0_seq1:119-1300(-)